MAETYRTNPASGRVSRRTVMQRGMAAGALLTVGSGLILPTQATHAAEATPTAACPWPTKTSGRPMAAIPAACAIPR